MTTNIHWGILGAGSIANKFATDLANLSDAKLLAVGSRDAGRAQAFAEKHGAERAYGSYANLVHDPDVDVIYVATPHPFHKAHTILCLEQGKAVLCEKPMAINAGQVREMVTCARENDAFLMEAMWTRCLPVSGIVRRWLEEERVGEVRMLQADFGFRTGWNPEGRLLNPELAGGALLDVGVYIVALAYMVFGESPVDVQAAAHIGETGVDEQTGMLLHYDGGELALLSCAIRTGTRHEARIIGTEGSIYIPTFWRATSATLDVRGESSVTVTEPSGYHYEAAEVMACLHADQRESALIPLEESISIAETLDRVRGLIGLRYPMED